MGAGELMQGRPGRKAKLRRDWVLSYLFACFTVFRNIDEEEKIKAREERKSNKILFYPASQEAVGGRKTEGERNPQLLSGPIKSSSSTFCWRAEDVINSEAEGVLGLNWASAGSFACTMTSLFLEHEASKQVKDLPPPGTGRQGSRSVTRFSLYSQAW